MLKNLITLFSACLLLSMLVQAQEKPVSQDEFDAIWESVLAATAKRPRRVTTISETRTKDRITGTEKHVEEYIPGRRHRFLDSASSGSKSTLTESIEIDGTGYQRMDSGPWTEWTGSPMRQRAPRSGPLTFCDYDTCTFKTTESVLDGNTVRLIVREKSNGKSMARVEVNKVWISWDGVILKIEDIETEGPLGDWKRVTTARYEYDLADLRIEAPRL